MNTLMERFQITARINSRKISHVIPAVSLELAKERFKAAYRVDDLDVIGTLRLGVRRKPYARRLKI